LRCLDYRHDLDGAPGDAGFSLCAFDGLFLKLGCSGGMRMTDNLPVVIYGVISGLSDDNDHGMSPEALYMHAP
jgi:hypothetical protein